MTRITLPCTSRLLALLLLCQPALPIRADTPAQALANEFDRFFNTLVATEGVTGAAYVIAAPDGIVRTGAHGHTDTSRIRRVDQNTVFRVASVSKTFAAGLTGLLVEEGRLTWDDRVTDYLPDFRIAGDSTRLRLAHLLGQSTGLMPHAYDNLVEEGVPLEQIHQKFRQLSYLCAPGECYTYQNSIFSLIGPVIEKATTLPYASLVEERIFRPLDMQTASLGYAPLVNNPNHAKPHVKIGGHWKTVDVEPNYYQLAPAAGVNASALDMGKWLVAQMGGRPAVFSPALIDALIEPRVETTRDKHRKFWRDLLTDAHYGLGWRIYRIGERDIAYHSGWVSGYRADLAWSRGHGIGIAVLMNAEDTSISELTTTFWRMAFAQLPAKTSDVPRVAAAGPRSP